MNTRRKLAHAAAIPLKIIGWTGWLFFSWIRIAASNLDGYYEEGLPMKSNKRTGQPPLGPTREDCLEAGEEVARMMILVTDTIPDSLQLSDLMTVGMKALKKISSLNIRSLDRPRVQFHMMEGILHVWNQGPMKLDSRVEFEEGPSYAERYLDKA